MSLLRFGDVVLDIAVRIVSGISNLPLISVICPSTVRILQGQKYHEVGKHCFPMTRPRQKQGQQERPDHTTHLSSCVARLSVPKDAGV